MKLGMIGLGRMGASLVRRLIKGGHHCVVHDSNAGAVTALQGRGISGARTLDEFVSALEKPRIVWLMVPAGITGSLVDELAVRLEADDIIIDGGNSCYRDDLLRVKALARRGIHFVDCGTSGGVFGLDRGFCLMIGGEKRIVRYLDPVFKSIAPGISAVPRTLGKKSRPDAAEQGYLHCGPAGAGHFVKMVHNGIEYGLMAAYAEGFNILRKANAGMSAVGTDTDADAETSPMRNPEHYQYEFDLPQIAEVWRRGSVIGSWLLDLSAASLQDNPDLAQYAGRVSDSGEGRWAIAAAIDEAVPVPVLSAALYERFSSRGEADFANRMLSAMRQQFGGHFEKESATRRK